MTTSPKLTATEMRYLYHEGQRIGNIAGKNEVPEAMIVEGYENDPISDGVCGFAWVNIKPGTSRFARWLVRNGYARKDSYYGGITIWIHEHRQSMTRKAAHASTFARWLRDNGINAVSMSRMD